MTWYYDAHVHLSDPYYRYGMETTLRGMENMRIKACCVSTCLKDSMQSLDLAEGHDTVFPFVGIHPEYAVKDSLEEMTEVIQQNHEKITGIGEIGLDPTYVEDNADARRQAQVFEALLDCAEKFGKPVSVHSRKSIDNVLETLTSYDAIHVLLHWFDGSKKHLRRAMDMGLYVSYGPVMVYANDKQALLGRTDESRILVETDGPVRFARCFEMKSGQVGFIPSVIFCASKILGRSFDDMAALLEKNSCSFLGI